MTGAAALRVLLAGGVAALLLSACSSEQVARSFGNWCKRADTCTDNSRTQPQTQPQTQP